MTTFGYGLASSADGLVYDWVFPIGTTYWDQMAAMIAYLGQKEGGVEKLDRDMFGGLLDLRDLTVSDVMIHRTEMITINADDPPEDLVKAMLEAIVTLNVRRRLVELIEQRITELRG